MLTKMVFALAVWFLLYVTFVQDNTIARQRLTMWEMTRNPACMVAPFPVVPKLTPKPLIPNPLELREQ